MVLERHLLLRFSLGYVREILTFVGKHPNIYPKDVCFFFIFFHSNEEELIQQVRLTKYIENKISKYTSNKTKNKRRKAKA